MAQKAKVACILSNDFEDSEFRIPYDRMKNQGYEIDIIGAKGGQEIAGKTGKERVKSTKGIDEARPEDYQALFIPGGYSPDHLRLDRRFVDFVKSFDQQKKTVAAVCHGPQIMIAADLVKGRTLTAWPTIQEDLKKLGANVKDQPVVEDGNWITSRKPDDLQQFSEAVVRRLG
jgi:protease I